MNAIKMGIKMDFSTKNFIITTSILLIVAVQKHTCCLLSSETFEDTCIKTIVCHGSMQMQENLQEYINMCQHERFNPHYGNYEIEDTSQIRLELHDVTQLVASEFSLIDGQRSIRDNVKSLNSSGSDWTELSWPLLGGEYKHLNVLNVSHNFLTTIDTADIVNFMKNLTILDLSYNQIRFINKTTETEYAPYQPPSQYEDYPIYDNPDPQILKKESSPLRTLLLSHNRLQTIGGKALNDFVFLRKLDVSYNNIQSKSLDFEGLENLVELNLSYNNISFLGSSLATFKKLLILDISFNQLSEISEENFRYSMSLRVLNITSNRIKHINSNVLEKMLFLQKLDLSNNLVVGDIFSLIAPNIRLKVINVQNNSISVLKKNTFMNHNLTSIDISGNQISGKIEKDTFAGFPDMTEMDLSGQRFTEVGSFAFKGAPSLIKLNLSSNSISLVDQLSFRGLTNLKYLDLSKNYLESVDFEKKYLVDLIWLSLETNNLKRIKENIFSGLNSLHHLDVSNNFISQIAANSLSLDSLTNLRFSNNSLSGVLQSNAFQGLTCLPKLDISYSQLTSLSNETFVDLKLLLELNISHNNLSDVNYNAFVNMNKLQILDLSYNNLLEFHVNTSSISNLQTIYLNYNNLLRIKDIYFKNLTGLRTLILSHNRITEIENNSLSSLEKLTEFDVANNSLTHIPRDTFMHHRFISSVDISNNKLTEENFHLWNIYIGNINVKGNQISEISKLGFTEINSLQVFDVSYNRLTQISSQSLRFLSHLLSFDISGNMITNIAPGSFTNHSSIVFLNVSHNNLESFSFGTFNGLNHLEILDVSYNNIFEINPYKFETLKALRYLSIDHNKIESFNLTALLNLVHITKISIGENPLDCNWLSQVHQLVDAEVLVVTIEALTLTHHTENVRQLSCNEGTSSAVVPKTDSSDSKEMFRYFDRLASVLKSGMDAITKNLSETQHTIVEELNDLNRNEKHVVDILHDFAGNFTSNSHINGQENKETSAASELIKEQNFTLSETIKALKNVIETMHERQSVVGTDIPKVTNITKETSNNNIQSETFKLIDITKNLNLTMIDFHNKMESTKIEMKDMRDKMMKELEEVAANRKSTKTEASSMKLSHSGKDGAVSLALTESCVIIILIILCVFIAYKVYQSKRWRPRSTSPSTQRISNEMEI